MLIWRDNDTHSSMLPFSATRRALLFGHHVCGVYPPPPNLTDTMFLPNVNLSRISDVGRVSDWHKANSGSASTATVPASEDPGVTLTTDLKDYFVTHGLSTEVMGASFRSVEQVMALAGCDHLTIGES